MDEKDRQLIAQIVLESPIVGAILGRQKSDDVRLRAMSATASILDVTALSFLAEHLGIPIDDIETRAGKIADRFRARLSDVPDGSLQSDLTEASVRAAFDYLRLGWNPAGQKEAKPSLRVVGGGDAG